MEWGGEPGAEGPGFVGQGACGGYGVYGATARRWGYV